MGICGAGVGGLYFGMLQADYLAGKFEQALPFARYVESGEWEQQRRWAGVYDVTRLTDEQRALVTGFTRDMKILVVSGLWCGDCVQQCPLLARIAEANPARVDLRFLDRDTHKDLAEQVKINGGNRVPAVLFLAEDYEFCALAGDRTISRYRAMARRDLGSACPTGIVPPTGEEWSNTLQDWLSEVERVQLMLRLSARLRQKHGD